MVRVGPYPIWLMSLCKKRKFGHRRAQGKDDVRSQGEGGPLQAEERALRGNQTCWHFGLGLSASRTWRRYVSVVCTSQSVVVCYGGPSTLMQVEWGRARGAQWRGDAAKTWSVMLVGHASKTLLPGYSWFPECVGNLPGPWINRVLMVWKEDL